MKVGSVSEEISSPSQKWTPDGGRSSFDDRLEEEKLDSGTEKVKSSAEKEKSSAAMVKADLGQRPRRRW